MSPLEHRLRLILGHLYEDELESLLDLLPQDPHAELQEPESGLIMLRQQDVYEETFYAGEILVTQVELQTHGIRSQATVMGDDSRKAVMAAWVSACEQHPEATVLLGAFREELERVETAVALRRVEEDQWYAGTAVQFESMAEEEEL